MGTERELKIKMITDKMSEYEVGSVPHNVYKEILDELTGRKITLHVAEEVTCESCQ